VKYGKRILIGIAGPSCAGKSRFTSLLAKIISPGQCCVLAQDNYYKDWSHLSREERKRINFDDARVFDFGLLIKHLKQLKLGKPITMPIYDFVCSRRLKKTKYIDPKRIVLVEGLMPFLKVKLRKLFDYRIYIKVSNGVCLSRRIGRDIKERGESIESVCYRYFVQVLPMQRKYVEPQKKYADLLINGERNFNKKLFVSILKQIP
jgi:uridine kinase